MGCGCAPPDLVGVAALDFAAIQDSLSGAIASSNASSNLRLLRVLRALRLIKLVRLVRTSRIIARWETKFSVNYSVLEVSKVLLQIFLVTHWFACMWMHLDMLNR